MTPERVSPSRTALLVIDIQRDFASPDGAMAKAGADMTAVAPAVTQAQALVEAARAAGVLLVFSRVVAPDGPVGRAGTGGTDFVDPLPRADELVVSKPRYSVLAGTGLAETLNAKGIDTLVLCGLTTECCIQSSAWAAFELDFHVLLATDAMAAYQPDLHQAALRALELNGAILAPTAAIAAAWK
jgi:ureidoacrylate peracid hydrolase